MEFSKGTVYFSGAGPGDPELITVKTLRLIRSADLILYAGSLVNPQILSDAKENAILLNTASMTLADQIAWMQKGNEKGWIIARLHTGDPSIYGAITEQIQALEKSHIPWQIIPGVTAAFAAAAALGIEYTLPNCCQSLIITRTDGRTPVPSAESLHLFAEHHCSMAIYLSAGMMDKIHTALSQADYPETTPIAIVSRAGWPDQKVLRCTLQTLELTAEEAGITHQALVIVSPALEQTLVQPSHLYGNYQGTESGRNGAAIITLGADSIKTGRLILENTENADLYIPEKFCSSADMNHPNIHPYTTGVRQILQEAFQINQTLVCIMAAGIVFRELAPLIHDKRHDPAVLVLDNEGRHVISLLSGHLGGANEMAKKIARITGGEAVITTASDNQQIPPLDNLIRDYEWRMENSFALTGIMSAMTNHEPLACISSFSFSEGSRFLQLPWTLYKTDECVPENTRNAVFITDKIVARSMRDRFDCCLILHPRTLVLGIGCNKGTSTDEITAFIKRTFEEKALSLQSISAIATVAEKASEPGLIRFAEENALKIQIIPHEAINALEKIPNPSTYAEKYLQIRGVAEPCAMIAANTDTLLLEKQKSGNVTLSIAEIKEPL